jgi:imidazolonepropionase-like amidohydrolase
VNRAREERTQWIFPKAYLRSAATHDIVRALAFAWSLRLQQGPVLNVHTKQNGWLMSGKTIITGDRLIDVRDGRIIDKPVILVDGQRIEKVGTAAEIKATPEDQIINAEGCTLLPGLIDTHVHISAFNPLTFDNLRVATFEVTPQLQTFYALFHAQTSFEMGFTTLRDLGRLTPRGLLTEELCAARDAIGAGIIAGPRLIIGGRAVIPNSHLDLTIPRNAWRPANSSASGPYGLRHMVREQLRMGCDVIKTSVSGGGGTDKEEPDVRNMTQEELDAIVDETHAFHKPVSAHCFTAESHKMAVKAKVDTIEHIVFTTDESIKMIKDSGIPVIPTLLHRTDEAIESRRHHGTPAFVLDKMKKIQPYCFESFQKMHQAGIPMAMGTDLGYDPEAGRNAVEMELYVNLGMSTMEAIQCATVHAAKAIWREKEIGTVEPGKRADIIAVKGNPLDDIKLFQNKENIQLVMRNGEAFVDKLSSAQRYVIHAKPGAWKIIDIESI